MNKELDWARIARLMKIGIVAALMGAGWRHAAGLGDAYLTEDVQ